MRKKINFGTLGGAIDGDKLWFSNTYMNMLCYYDLNEKRIYTVEKFPDQSYEKKDLHISVFVEEDEVIFTPYLDNAIRIYNKNTKTFKSFHEPMKERLARSKSYNRAVRIKDCIYFASGEGDLYFYDVKQHELQQDEKVSEIIKEYIRENGDIIGICPDNNGFSVLAYRGNRILRLDIKNETSRIIDLPPCVNDYEYAYCDEEYYWMYLANSTNIARVAVKNKSIDILECGCAWGKTKYKQNCYNRLITGQNGTHYISNYNGDSIIRIGDDGSTGILAGLGKYRIVNTDSWGPIFTDIIEDEDAIYFLPYHADGILKYNFENKETELMDFSLNVDDIYDYNRIILGLFKSLFKENGLPVCEENSWCGLNGYLDYMKQL